MSLPHSSSPDAVTILADVGLPSIPKNWGIVRIDDLITKERGISVGVMYPGVHDPFGIPLVKAGDLAGNRINPKPAHRITKEKHFEYRRTELSGGEILLSLVGDIGRCAIVPDHMAGWNSARATAVIRLKDPADARFVRLCLLSSQLQHLMGAWATTTVQATLNLKEIKQIPLPWPPKPIRDRIATVVGTLDDKIELNRQMNETLEAMARRLFKSWFVDFDPVHAKAALRREHPRLSNADLSRRALPNMAPEVAELFPDGFEESVLGAIPKGWRLSVLDDMTEMVIGGDWGKDIPCHEFSTAVFCIRGADIPDLQSSGLGKMPTRYLKPASVQKRGMRVGDLAFEISGGSPTQSTGRPVLVTQQLLDSLAAPLTCSNFCRLIRPADPRTSCFLYYYLRHLYDADEFLQYENGTTGIKNLAFATFSSLHTIVVPPTIVTAAFDTLVHTMLVQRCLNGQQMRSLIQTRDRLLPRMLSGDLQLND